MISLTSRFIYFNLMLKSNSFRKTTTADLEKESEENIQWLMTMDRERKIKKKVLETTHLYTWVQKRRLFSYNGKWTVKICDSGDKHHSRKKKKNYKQGLNILASQVFT